MSSFAYRRRETNTKAALYRILAAPFLPLSRSRTSLPYRELRERLAPLSIMWLLATSALYPAKPAFAQASTAQYFYDAAGRLVGVLDSNGSTVI
jgi:hypothetical protein